MNMQESVLYIVLALLGVVIYLLLSQRKHKGDDKNKEEIDNGVMLSCYPENVLLTDAFLLKALTEINNSMWWNVYQKIYDKNVPDDEKDIFLEFFKLVPKK